MNESVSAAVAAGALAAEAAHRPLLQSIVDVARAILGARASSIMVLDEAAGELVFEAVTGEGEDELVGTRLPASTGVAGWVAQSRQPLIIEDVSQDPRFDIEAARRTGYIPQGLMAVPLIYEDTILGVLNVLDRPQRSRFSLAEMDLLELFAQQAATALHLLLQARRTQAVLTGSGDDLVGVSRLAATVDALEGPRREAALRMIAELDNVLRPGGRAS
ncbi:MAG TPA: GAF domain-containing protein [Solirubrobacteraceae bacterium]|jgi:GAF domain-containing protein|nr:GAF domain-containing protein [Solirubrobacteraceae bacterium]